MSGRVNGRKCVFAFLQRMRLELQLEERDGIAFRVLALGRAPERPALLANHKFVRTPVSFNNERLFSISHSREMVHYTVK